MPRRPVPAPAPGSQGVALVLGASRGLGLLVARDLAHRGYAVSVCSRDRGALERAEADHAREGVRVTSYVCDVSDGDAVARLVEQVEAAAGPVEVAVHVAGTISVGPFASLERRHFEQALATMAWGPVHLALALVPRMRARGRGRLGIVASVGGLVGVPHLLPYSTAKFAAVGFSTGLRAELAGTGVTVTTVAPGLMRTGSHVRAEFTGAAGEEYAWFAPGASLPLVSMDAGRAARQLVDGVLRGRAVVVPGPWAKVVGRVAGVAPTLSSWVTGAVGRALPAAPGGPTPTLPGTRARQLLPRRARAVVGRLTTLGDRASRRNLEV